MADNNRILISATGSSCGKTTILSALLYLLKQKIPGLRAFKCGPDYIDPMYHRKVLGIPSGNLDPYFCDAELLKSTFTESAGQLNVIEGAMGLFDGMGVTSEFGTYHVARILKCPVILIVDCSGMGASIMAVIAGFLSMDTDRLIRGVILNRISPSFCAQIRERIEAQLHVKVLGYLPEMKNTTLESRHLGLKAPEETKAIEKIAQTAEILGKNLDLQTLVRIAESAPDLMKTGSLADHIHADLSGKRIAVAADRAFSFYYEDNLKALTLAGAKLTEFSPLADRLLPDGTDAVYMGGGYPEIYAEELAANASFKKSLVQFVDSGKPLLAECGAFMYLQDEIDGYPMAGVFHGKAVNTGKLVRFGYIRAEYRDYKLKGHEFHYYDTTDPGHEFAVTKASTGKCYRAVCRKNRTLAGFPHFYFLSDSRFLEIFK